MREETEGTSERNLLSEGEQSFSLHDVLWKAARVHSLEIYKVVCDICSIQLLNR